MISKILNILKGQAGKKILKGSSTIFICSLIGVFIGYFIRIILARSLTPAEYGLFYAVFSIVAFSQFTKDFGLGTAIAKYIPQYLVEKRKDYIKTITVIMLLVQFISTLILGIVLYFLSDFLAVHYFKNPTASWLLKSMIIYLVLIMFFKFYKSFFQGYQKMTPRGLLEPLKNGTILICVILLVGKIGIKGVAIAYIMSAIIPELILFRSFIKLYPWREKIVNFWPLFKQMFYFGIPVTLTMVGGELISYFDTFTLTYFRSLTEVGIYQVILPTTTSILLLARSVVITIYPMISEYWAKKEFAKIKYGLKLFYKLSPLLIFVYFIAFILAKPFLYWFFGAEYLPGLTAMRILFLGAFIYFIAMVNIHTLAAVGFPKTNAFAILTGAGVNIIFNILFIPYFGIEGAAVATVISYIWIVGYSSYKVKKLVLNV